MISFPISSLNPSKLSNRKLAVGRHFLNLLSDEGLLTSDYSLRPVILGGVVRDAVFREREPNDVDIFFYRNLVVLNSMGSSSARVRVDRDLRLLKENLLVWLEDLGLEYESLLTENDGQYPGSVGRFLDIISFEWSGATIQIMIPSNYLNTSMSVGNLLSSMPIVCGVGMTQNYIYSTYAFAGSLPMLTSRVYPIAHDRDIAYVVKKFGENSLIRRYNNSDELVNDSLGRSYSEFATVPASTVSGRDRMPQVTKQTLVRNYFTSLFGDIEFTIGAASSMPVEN